MHNLILFRRSLTSTLQIHPTNVAKGSLTLSLVNNLPSGVAYHTDSLLWFLVKQIRRYWPVYEPWFGCIFRSTSPNVVLFFLSPLQNNTMHLHRCLISLLYLVRLIVVDYTTFILLLHQASGTTLILSHGFFKSQCINISQYLNHGLVAFSALLCQILFFLLCRTHYAFR